MSEEEYVDSDHDELKYPVGTVLLCLKSSTKRFTPGKEYVVKYSRNWRNSYRFTEVGGDDGWCFDFIENEENFVLANIDNWKARLGGD